MTSKSAGMRERRMRSASAGGQLEQPSEVNSSTTTAGRDCASAAEAIAKRRTDWGHMRVDLLWMLFYSRRSAERIAKPRPDGRGSAGPFHGAAPVRAGFAEQTHRMCAVLRRAPSSRRVTPATAERCRKLLLVEPGQRISGRGEIRGDLQGFRKLFA